MPVHSKLIIQLSVSLLLNDENPNGRKFTKFGEKYCGQIVKKS